MLICILYFLSFVDILTLISLNAQGLRTPNHRQAVFNSIKKNKYDLIFLHETHWTDHILREWGGTILFNNFEYNARGTVILFHPTFDFQIHDNTCDRTGRTIQTLIEHTDCKFNLINIYAPGTNTERRIYFHLISTFLSPAEANILGGDFNCISDDKLDKLGRNPSARQTENQILQTITQQHHLTDIWRDRNRDAKKFTWTGKHPHNNSFNHTRIDKFYISTFLHCFTPSLLQETFYHSPSLITTLSCPLSIYKLNHTVRDTGILTTAYSMMISSPK